jgi:hypothetical protein
LTLGSLTGNPRPLADTRGTDELDPTDRKIHQLVYELYGLTEEEIRTVEEAAQ